MQNVLVVDDEEPVRRLLRDCLELDGYEVREAADALQAIDRIGESLPDCVLLDVMMPGMSGLELLERLREDPITAGLPVMMLTAATDDDTTWTGWANGASCYVPKPFDIDHMLDWVSRLCAPLPEAPVDPDVFNIDVIDVDLAAFAVPVTPADWFSDQIPAPAEPANRSDSAASSAPVALSSDWAALTQEPLAELSDIAHPAVPAAASEAAASLAAPSSPVASAWQAAPPPAVPATDSGGEWAATYDGPQAEELVRAMETGQFWVAYLPIVALGTELITGVEALARWAHPQRGDLSPQEFLPLAERNGLAGRLDDVIVLEAVQQVSKWNAVRRVAGHDNLTLSINVSSERLTFADFCATLRHTLESNGLAPASVVLELGEVALMRLFAGDQKVAHELIAMGVKLAFDDFSAAATSLDYLQRFQVDFVKVDRSLVRRLGLDDNSGGDSTVAAIISIAHRLGRAVVAEGVETSEQAAHLRRLGCEYAQGFHFGFPASAAHIGPRLLPAPE